MTRSCRVWDICPDETPWVYLQTVRTPLENLLEADTLSATFFPYRFHQRGECLGKGIRHLRSWMASWGKSESATGELTTTDDRV